LPLGIPARPKQPDIFLIPKFVQAYTCAVISLQIFNKLNFIRVLVFVGWQIFEKLSSSFNKDSDWYKVKKIYKKNSRKIDILTKIKNFLKFFYKD